MSDLWERDGLHCGETLSVQLPGGDWADTRIEMTAKGEWYLVGTPYHGDLEYIKARIA